MCTVHCADGHARCLAVQPGYKAELPALLDSVIFRRSRVLYRGPYATFWRQNQLSVLQKAKLGADEKKFRKIRK